MCGRTSCHCSLGTYQKACTYFDENLGRYVKPMCDQPSGHEFRPSTNLVPTQCSPVILSGNHLAEETTTRVIRPMIWGMIPPWHQGNYKSHGLSTNNCRIESVLSSKLFSGCLKKGYRCIVVCDGFYEWQTTKGKNKQPYFIYSQQPQGMHPEIVENWNEGVCSDSRGWSGPVPLLMAGLFSMWNSPEDELKYSYSVITMESTEVLSWLHHRMPAILTSDEQVRGWLDYDDVPFKEALEFLEPVKNISYHPVSNQVNNSRNQDSCCNKPVSLKKENKSSMLMQAWLQKGKRESTGNGKSFDENQLSSKKVKTSE